MGQDRIIATTLGGLEEVLADEIAQLGGENIRIGTRMVRYTGDTHLLYTSCYRLRTALRVLRPITWFRIRDERDLYNHTIHFPWRKILGPDQTLAITSVLQSRMFRHSNFPALVVKDAICDRIRREVGRRPNIDRDNPDVRVNLHIHDNTVDLALDAGGASLHQRGYRRYPGHAPINEVLAAGLLRLAQWKPSQPIYDPMCGSATLLIEAAESALDVPAQIRRPRMGFQGWRDFDPRVWRIVRQESPSEADLPALQLTGADEDPGIIKGSTSNVRSAGMHNHIDLQVADFFTTDPPKLESGMLFLNPPYDERIPVPEVEDLYKEIGNTLKQRYAGWTAWVLSANKAAMRQIGLKSSRRFPVFNGPLEAEFCRYDLY